MAPARAGDASDDAAGDQGHLVVFVVVDILMLSNEDCAEARRLIAATVGCPERNVVVSATHTHSGMYR